MKKLSVLILTFVFGLVLFAPANCLFAQSSDAIAIRVIPNPKHQSISHWFAEQGFKGSPQSLTVDGYEAVRDGRTVYVNVGNITPAGLLFTNVYLISYNQDAELPTTDIFGNILANWNFNSNLLTHGQCRYQGAKSCLLDEDCPIGDYCRSSKARVIRDVKRLSDASIIRAYLNEYKNINGRFPTLSSGSYLINRSFSAWPSWQSTFGRELGRQLPFDPVNRFGDCPGFNEQTCWSEETARFASSLPNFPDGSLVYYYYSDSVGLNADVCIVSESGFAINPSPNCLIDVCLDFDDDDYGYPASASCVQGIQDCDDSNPAINVPAAEDCVNDIDDDCNGLVDCFDAVCSGDPACGIVSFCGDAVCDIGETCPACPECCTGPVCGNTICEPGECASCYNFAGQTATADCFCGDLDLCVVQGEECDDLSANCDASCQLVAPSCVDNDGDLYIDGLEDIAVCNALSPLPCGLSGNMACLGNDDCDDEDPNRFPGYAPWGEQCDNVDHDCVGGVANGLSEELCDWACVAAGFDWRGNGGNLNCCGNHAGEGNSSFGTFQNVEDVPDDYCSDSIDNDCDGTFDSNIANLVNPDTDCLPCESSSNTDESFWYVATESDCNQCDHNGDDQGNQEDAGGPFWSVLYPAQPDLPDRCDPACNAFFADPKVSPASQAVHIDDYEDGTELTCDDDLDNDCDGLMNCDDPDCAGSPSCIFSCTGSKPLNSSLCTNDDIGLIVDTPITLVPVCTLGQLCEYECDPPFSFVGGICMRDCYRDSDSDGFGDSADVAQYEICPGVGIYVEDNSDCDDTRDYVFPGATEQCNGLNSDCDASTPVDAGCDDDNDNHCDNTMDWFAGTSECDLTTSGPLGDDCDDNGVDAASRYPTNPEVCAGNIDEDCDGLVDCADVVDCPCSVTEDCSTPAIDEDGDGCFDDTDSDCGGVENCDAAAPGDDDCDGRDNASDPDCSSNTCTLDFSLPCILW